MTLIVRVITPDRTVWDGPVQEVILPSTTGKLGILVDHAPLLTILGVGVLRLRVQKRWLAIALMGGFAEVENNEVTILVNDAERGDLIDRQLAQEALILAEAEVQQASNPRAKIKAQQALRRARARLQAAVS